MMPLPAVRSSSLRIGRSATASTKPIHPGRRRRQSRRRRARQHDLSAAGAEERRRAARDLRRLQRRGARTPGATNWARARASRPAFNTEEHQEFSLPFDCEAKVVKLSDGQYVGRRGVLKEVSSDMGPCAPARSRRYPDRGDQPSLPVHGPAAVRDVRPRHRPGARRRGQEPRPFPRRLRRILQARADLRSRLPGLDVAGAGHNFTWTKLPRPVYPLDEETSWTPPRSN